MKQTLILAVESSCDETAVAVVADGKEILSNVVATQIDVHKEFGGVIPEVASRIHVENISMVIEEALHKANVAMEDIDAVAVTQGPGLVGCLHIGVQAAKTLAWAFHKPLVPVHHIAGHIYANRLITDLKFPLLALVVSGGHTELVYMKDEWSFEILGTTQDDAIGEAGDKVGRVLGLPYPGGVYVDRIAKEGKPMYKLARPKTENPLIAVSEKMKPLPLLIWLHPIRKPRLAPCWSVRSMHCKNIILLRWCLQVVLPQIPVCVKRWKRVLPINIRILNSSFLHCPAVQIMRQ